MNFIMLIINTILPFVVIFFTFKFLYKNRSKIMIIFDGVTKNFGISNDLNKGGGLICLSGIISFILWGVSIFGSLSSKELQELQNFTILPALLLALGGFFIAKHK